MAWKKDLAKLKQDLKKEDPAPPKAPPPSRGPSTPVSQSIEEEDAIFLSAMGLRPQSRALEAPVPEPPPPPLVRVEPTEAAAPATFASAMGDLKGMKPMRGPAVAAKANPTLKVGDRPAAPPSPRGVGSPSPAPAPRAQAPVTPAPVAPPTEVPAPAVAPSLAPAPAEPPSGATEIHLAAGMAIEVDGVLELRGHGRSDGEERLKERILDGYALGWRTLHVTLGPSPELRDMVLALVKGADCRCVTRYAQAPIPMGGPQAWILYFRPASETP